MSDLLGRLARRERSCEETVRSCLEAIAARDGELRAFVATAPEAALARARELDRRGPAADLPLFGLPVGVKDVFDTADMPTEYGSPIHAGHRPARDADMVAALRAAGAVIVGKTATAEFACMHPAATRNPRDPARTPGGSSSGSGAAVAAGLVTLATATQTAGSLIRPAAYCEVVGYKPTFGVLPRGGVLPTSETLDTLGLIGESVELVRAATLALLPLMRASRRPLGEEFTGEPRLGKVRFAWERLEASARDAFESAAGEEVEIPELDALCEAQFTIQRRETATALQREFDAGGLSEELHAYIAAARAQVSEEEYLRARRVADELRWRVDDVLRGFDAVFAPAVLGEPPLGLEFTGDSLPCRPWMLHGGPCVTLPLGLAAGVQLVGAVGADERVLGAARWLERGRAS